MNVGAAAVRGTEPDERTLGVAAGDLLAILAVLTVGLLRHGTNPLTAPRYAALVVAPFVFGWALSAVLLGAYASETLASPRATVGLAVLSWVGAVAVGAAIRATPTAPGGASPVFVAVMLGFGGLAVGAWRTVVALV